MAAKMDEPISNVRGWINGRTEIAVAIYYSHMIRGAQLPSPQWDRNPDWDTESGFGLAR